MNTLHYYKTHGRITDPGMYLKSLSALAYDVDTLAKQIQSLLLHANDAGLLNYAIPLHRKVEMNARTAEQMLKNIFAHDSAPLTQPRPVSQRLIAICRDFSVLACAVLRVHGIAARARYGFSHYYAPFFHDMVLLEYWHVLEKRWCLADMRTTLLHSEFHHFQIDYDVHDIPRDKFMTAAAAWKRCRAHPPEAQQFGAVVKEKLRGLWYVRNILMADLSALNKNEPLMWDTWGYMLKNNFAVDPYEAAELRVLDELAEVLDQESIDLDQLSTFYHHPMLQMNVCSR